MKSVEVNTETGIVGDHYSGSTGKRHITLIQSEHLETVAKLLGKESINPDDLRRNLVVKGIPLLSLADKEFCIGEEVVLRGTGKCRPCSRMEENLGFGGYNAMRGHGGITAQVISGGTIKCGDQIKLHRVNLAAS